MSSTRQMFSVIAALTCAVALAGCGASGATPSSSPPPPPPAVTVSVTPPSATPFLGQTISFSATVKNATSTLVNWSVNSIPGGNLTVGTISDSGVYTAPQVLPLPATVTVTATSAAAPSASASVSVTIQCDVSISIAPSSAQVTVNASQAFTARVAGSGNPDTTVRWVLAGAGCTGAACGTQSSTGANAATYTAPAALPSPPAVTVSAISVADPVKSASAAVTVQPACTPAVRVSPTTASVALAQQQSFQAVVCFSANQTITWSLTGPGCNGSACGTVSSTGPSTATYTAPATLPSANPVTLLATSQADTTQSGAASITVVSNVTVQLPFDFDIVAQSHRRTLSATVTDTTDQAVTWAVNGTVNGSAAAGQICAAGSNPCAAPPAPTAGKVDYLAPSSLPASNPVVIRATSSADPTRSAGAQLEIVSHLAVRVAPAAAFIAPLGTAQFVAAVLGTSNSAVTWRLSCSAASCGSISPDGTYSAPAAAPSPNSITVIATSQDDPSQSATATVAVASAITVESLAPASATAGAAEGFPLAVAGLHFSPTTPGAGSTVLVAGAARVTACASALQCTVNLLPADVANAGSFAVQVESPDGALSNTVSFVVVPPATSEEVIALTSAEPLAAAKDVLAIDPSTAGSGVPQPAILLVGLVDATGAGCNLGGGPILLPRPVSGTAATNICLLGNDLDSSFAYSLSGPKPEDVALSNPRLLAGLVELTVTVSSSATPGPRTLFATDANHNRASATGAIEVK
jgi:hypothetical protein